MNAQAKLNTIIKYVSAIEWISVLNIIGINKDFK
jgi:hypothetical protein